MSYSIGGGGGKASGPTENEGHAQDKPYDLYFPLTADSVQQLNEMFDLLFKSATKTAADVADAASTSGGSGDVTGPSSVTDGDIALFNGATGKIIKDGSKLGTDLVTGPASATTARIATFNGTSGKIIQDSGFLVSDVITSAGSLSSIEVTLTDAQIKTLNSSPVTIIPAPGANFFIHPIIYDLKKNTVAGAYNTAPTLDLRFSGVVMNLATSLSSTLSTAGTQWIAGNAVGWSSSATVENLGVVLFSSADVTGGNGANSLRVTIVYKIVPTT